MKVFPRNLFILSITQGTRWSSFLRHCAQSRRVEGSIHEGFIEIFQLYNSSGRTTALESNQPLTETSTRTTSWGVKDSGA